MIRNVCLFAIVAGLLWTFLDSSEAASGFAAGTRAKGGERSFSSQDEGVREALTMAIGESKIPGAAAAIVRHGKAPRVAAYGVRKAGSKEPFLPTDLVHIGSDTKAMTGVLIARLVDAGKLRWDSTIQDVLPDLAERIHGSFRDVTITQLMRHTSGAPANASDWRGFKNLPLRERRFEIAAKCLTKPGKRNPGDAYLYSNVGVMIAGAMAETACDATWEELMQREVFQPLGIESAGFGAPGTPGEVDQPWGHTKGIVGKLKPVQIDNDPALGPAGTVHLSMADWGKFVQEFMDASADSDFLTAASRSKLVEPGLEQYAFGWTVVRRSWAGGTALTHAGSNTTWFANAWIAPGRNLAFLVAANSAEDRVAAELDAAVVALLALADADK